VKNKNVIITGAAAGIGWETAQKFNQQNANLILADIDIKQLESNADKLDISNSSVMCIKTDVSDYKQMQNLFDNASKEFEVLDIVVNNAGIFPPVMARTEKVPNDLWNQTIAVNQTGVFYGMKLALKIMQPQKKGCIVNVASLSGLKASPNMIAYAASKFAVVGMTKTAASEYASQNIRVNAVCPAFTDTNMIKSVFEVAPDYEEKLKQLNPMKRFGKASEIAEAILWLSSDKSAFTTGECLVLDGGMSL